MADWREGAGPKGENMIGDREAKILTVEADGSVRGHSRNAAKSLDGRSRKVGRLDHKLTTNTEIVPGTAARSATGPRTKAGKRRSSQNATRHAIFSKAVLVSGESPKDYEILLLGLRRDRQPEGPLEEILVEKLATLVWRQNRHLRAESAEINKGRDFLVDGLPDFLNAQHHESPNLAAGKGILHACANPVILAKAIVVLTHLRDRFETHGLDRNADITILRKLYGNFSIRSLPSELPGGFLSEFITYGMIANAKPGEIVDMDMVDLKPEEARGHALACLGSEIKRLKEELIEAVESQRRTYTAQAMLVPKQEVLDRLQRYEAHLSREFDRTLRQLERLQRMRLGQPVPPPIQLEVSR